MADNNSIPPTQDERVMAALSHISAIIPMFGVVAPIIIWATQKDKSRFVAFQALQAVAYQLTMVLAGFVGMGCYMLSFFAILFPLSMSEGSSEPANSFIGFAALFPFLIFGAIFIIGFLFIVYGIIGAVMTFQGKPFRYLLIGKSVERFLEPKQDNREVS